MKFALLFISCALLSFYGTKVAKYLLAKANVFDIPNERSNHKAPILRGGGVAIVDTILLGVIVAQIWLVELPFLSILPLLLGGILLGAVSFYDDLKGLSVKFRLICQAVAVLLGVSTLLGKGAFFAGILPVWLDVPLMVVFWLWFINLFNFMDGIDGISASQTLTMTLSMVLLSMAQLLPPEYMYYGAVIGGAALGFLFLNWHPAKIFMGDVGSVVLGYFLGWLLVRLAVQGNLLVALLLPFYYLVDSGVTLWLRFRNGEKIWEAHSKHYYQQAVRSGKTHAEVVIAIIKFNGLLFAYSFIGILMPQYWWLILPVAAFSAYVFITRLLDAKESS